MNDYSPESLANLLAHCNEICFNARGDGSGVQLKGDADFAIYRGAYDRLWLRNDGPKKVFYDVYAVDPSQAVELEPTSQFIYDGDNFLFGFDPVRVERWRLDPDVNRGLEIRAVNFTKTFQRRMRNVGVENLNFTIQASEFVGIYGASGAGKSTLIESMIAPKEKAGLLVRFLQRHSRKHKQEGTILFDGDEVSLHSHEIAYLPQHIDFPESLKTGSGKRTLGHEYLAKDLQKWYNRCCGDSLDSGLSPA